MKTPVNSRTLKQHFRYSWWIYLLIALAAFGLVDLLYAMTAYRPPEDKKVEFYVLGYMNEEKTAAYMEQVRQNEMSDMELMAPRLLLDDSTYGAMQLMTFLSAGEGDVLLIPRDNFISLASSGTFLPLEESEEITRIFDEAGISLQSGWRKNTDTGETHLYGIPQNKLPGLSQYAYAQDGFLCAFAASGNEANTLKFLRILCRDMLKEPEAEATAAPAP